MLLYITIRLKLFYDFFIYGSMANLNHWPLYQPTVGVVGANNSWNIKCLSFTPANSNYNVYICAEVKIWKCL